MQTRIRATHFGDCRNITWLDPFSPLGTYTKPEIRQMAADFGLLRVADKPDSLRSVSYRIMTIAVFLKDRVPGLKEDVEVGAFVLSDGTVVGQHEGYPFYTIGQRHGLGLAMGEPFM